MKQILLAITFLLSSVVCYAGEARVFTDGDLEKYNRSSSESEGNALQIVEDCSRFKAEPLTKDETDLYSAKIAKYFSDRLRDPESFRIDNIRSIRKGPCYSFWVYFRAKNGYGGYNKDQHTLVFKGNELIVGGSSLK